MAITKKATLEDIAYAPNGHPTLSEAIKEAALNALARQKKTKIRSQNPEVGSQKEGFKSSEFRLPISFCC